MLYQIYETQRSLMEPFADVAQAASKLYSNPLSPLGQNPLAQRMSAGYDLMYRLWKDYEKPQFGITTVDVYFDAESRPPTSSNDDDEGLGHKVRLTIPQADVAEAVDHWDQDLQGFPVR